VEASIGVLGVNADWDCRLQRDLPTVRIVRYCGAPHALRRSTLAFGGRHLLIVGMSATKILWGQIILAFAVVLVAMWGTTQWVAWKLGYQPQLGQPWFELVPGVPVYLPPAFFWWWYAYDAYAPHVFVERSYIAASGGIASIAAAIAMSVWRAREAKIAATYAPLAGRLHPRFVSPASPRLMASCSAGSINYLRHDGPEHVLCFAPTRSGKGVGLVVPTLLT
jgi:type IV secretion system protein VirD4